MTRAVAEAISDGKRLIVEAGTGVGKSLAYLLPAALYALRNDKRVVVSTNTINLQEQLLGKDVPVASRAVAAVDPGDLRHSLLKGRANYLCLKRWAHLRSSPGLTDDEARTLSKVLVWLRDSPTGDRGEMNLSSRGARSPWDRMSAQGARARLHGGTGGLLPAGVPRQGGGGAPGDREPCPAVDRPRRGGDADTELRRPDRRRGPAPGG